MLDSQIMMPDKPSQIDPTDLPGRGLGSLMLAARSGLYILLVIAVAAGAGVYSLRAWGIFGCPATGYGSDSYLGYCQAMSYGDYDHGAIWFDLEPAAGSAAADAQVLFIGNSKTQFGFSAKATDQWFSSLAKSYYLLGFSHGENYTFEAPLLRKLRPKAKVYVINLDSFFERSETVPGKTVMEDGSSRTRYEEKQRWQGIHKKVCTTFKAVCGDEPAIFRSRSDGAWLATGGRFTSEPVSYEEDIDQNLLASSTPVGKKFVSSLPVDRGCTISTIVPTVKTELGTAKAIAAALDLNFVEPRVPGLMTFDGSHLDPESAQRWSAAFLETAGPQIQKCLSNQPDLHIEMASATVANR